MCSNGGGNCLQFAAGTYYTMLLAVLLCNVLAVRDVLLHGGVDDDLLGDGVTGELPDELVLPRDLRVGVIRVHDLLHVAPEISVVLDDGIGYVAHVESCCREGSDCEGWCVEGGELGPVEKSGRGPERCAKGVHGDGFRLWYEAVVTGVIYVSGRGRLLVSNVSVEHECLRLEGGRSRSLLLD
jgi:hypothetical protein